MRWFLYPMIGVVACGAFLGVLFLIGKAGKAIGGDELDYEEELIVGFFVVCFIGAMVGIGWAIAYGLGWWQPR